VANLKNRIAAISKQGANTPQQCLEGGERCPHAPSSTKDMCDFRELHTCHPCPPVFATYNIPSILVHFGAATSSCRCSRHVVIHYHRHQHDTAPRCIIVTHAETRCTASTNPCRHGPRPPPSSAPPPPPTTMDQVHSSHLGPDPTAGAESLDYGRRRGTVGVGGGGVGGYFAT
jgi:hypothetical protein